MLMYFCYMFLLLFQIWEILLDIIINKGQQNSTQSLDLFSIQMSQKAQVDNEVTRQFINVINAQAKLIDKLLHNQKHLLQSIRCLSGNDSSSFSSSALNNKLNLYANSKIDPYNFADHEPNMPKVVTQRKTKIISKMPQRQLFQSEMSEEELKQQSDQSEYKVFKIPETKNVIKNFSKSLFRFIQKHRVYVSRVLRRFNVKEEEFQKTFQRFKGKIYTIAELKQLWLPEGNEFHNVFRVISLQYIRKHSLNHIFNSRVINYKTHIKYRKKMYEILQSPTDFSSIKYN